MGLKKITARVCAALLALCLMGGGGALTARGASPVPTAEPERIPIGGPDYSPETVGPTENVPGTAGPTESAPESAGPAGSAGTGGECAVIGADLTNAQTEEVYAVFGLRRGDVQEISVTNAEERACLEGCVADEVIGSAALTSVYLRLLPPGGGTEILLNGNSRCTAEMYRSALKTAGVADVKAVIAAPDSVPGAAALAGIYKGYEALTGRALEENAKQAGARELAAAEDLAGQLENEDAAAIVDELKGILAEIGSMTDGELGAEIRRIAGEYNVTLNDGQVQMLVDLCRQLESLSESELAERIGGLGETGGKIRETVGTVVDTVKGFFSWVSGVFSGLFGKK